MPRRARARYRSMSRHPASPCSASAPTSSAARRAPVRCTCAAVRGQPCSHCSSAAATSAGAAMAEEGARIRALRERLWLALAGAAPAWRNGAPEPSVPGILSVGFAGMEGESLLLEIDGRIDASSGSACNSATGEPSYVLRALGLSDEAIQASL